MNEKETIKKLAELKEIRAPKEWAFSLKEELIKKEKLSLLDILFSPVKNPTLAIRGIMASFLILAAAFSYLYYLGVEKPKEVVYLGPAKGNDQQLISSLSNIKDSLKNIKNSLAKIEKSNNPEKVLVATEVVKKTANEGKEIIKKIKDKKPVSEKVYLSLNEVGSSLDNIEKMNYEIQKKIAKDSIDDLGKRKLGEKDKERLLKAEEYYKRGDISQALILITKIYNN